MRHSSAIPLRPCFLFLCLMLLASSGCRHGGGHADAFVRLINAAPDAQDLSVAVDGQKVWKHSQFRSNTGYQGVNEGNYQVAVDAQGNGGRLTGHSYLLCQKGKAYTVVAVGQPAGGNEPPALRLFNEVKDVPVPADKVRLRFINAGLGLGPVDVLFNNIVGFDSTAFGSRTQGLFLNPGEYAVKVVANGNVSPLIGPQTLHFLPGHSYTLVAMGRRRVTDNAQSLTLEAYSDDH